MKALVKYALGKGNMEIRDVTEPVPKAGEVKIKVKAAGICGSDLHIYNGDIQIPVRPPFVLGHEFTGVITEVGSKNSKFKIGTKVTAENSRYVCGHCRYCLTGNYNLCPERLATGYAFDGAFTSFCVVPEERIHILPDNVDFISGALSDPSACAYHAVEDLTGITAGDVVLITGPGPMGLFCLQYVKQSGGVVILSGTKKDKKRLELAKELGADFTVCIEEDVKSLVPKLTNGLGVDVFLECAGANAAAQLGLELLRKQGKYTQVGIFGSKVTVDLDQIVYKELKVTGSFSQKYLAWEKAIEFVSQNRIKVRPLVTDILPLNEWEVGFKKFRDGAAIKVVFIP